LKSTLDDYPWVCLVIVRDHGGPQSLAAPMRMVNGVLVTAVGQRAALNA
jgi:hypothetical protein